MNEIATMNDIQKMAETIAKSGLFGLSNPTQVAALMLVAQAEGLHPATAAKEYHIINGHPALKADAMLARFQKAGGSVRWTKSSDTEVAGVFSHPKGGELEVRWTAERAAKAQLKSPTWSRFPQQMLRARCISEGVRAVFPVVVEGVYVIEEAEDMEQEKQAKVEVVAAEVKPEPAPEAIEVNAEPVATAPEPETDLEAEKAAIEQAYADGVPYAEIRAKAVEKFGAKPPLTIRATLSALKMRSEA